jgi:hypothetical protein
LDSTVFGVPGQCSKMIPVCGFSLPTLALALAPFCGECKDYFLLYYSTIHERANNIVPVDNPHLSLVLVPNLEEYV